MWLIPLKMQDLKAMELLQTHALSSKTLAAFRKTRRGSFTAPLGHINGHSKAF